MTAEQASSKIYTQARAGTAVNPGLPPTLAYLLVAQAKHETGNFTSKFFKQYNNAFGYSYVSGGKYQTGSGTIADNGQPIAVYPDIESSTKEVIDWIYRRQKEGKFPANLETITTPETYAQLLKASGYYGDTLSNYLKGLKNFFSYNIPPASIGGGLLLLTAAAILWYVWRK